jgi:hypothetical protein
MKHFWVGLLVYVLTCHCSWAQVKAIDFGTEDPGVSGSGHARMAFNGTDIVLSKDGGAYGSFGGEGGAALPDTRGLTLTNDASNPAYQVDLHADWIVALSSDASTSATTSGFDDTWDITADLDTGSEASSTWYYGWLVYESSSWVPYFSESYTSVSGVAVTSPRIRLFSIYNDSSGDLRYMWGAGSRRDYIPDADPGSSDTDGYPPVFSGQLEREEATLASTSIDLSGYIPPHARRVILGCRTSTTSGDYILLFPKNPPGTSSYTPQW